MRRLTLSRVGGWNGPFATALGVMLALALGVLLLRLTPLEGVLLVGLVFGVVVTVFEPLIGLIIALFLGLMKGYLATWVPQVPAQVGHIFFALGLGVWLAQGFSRRAVTIPHSPLLLPLLFFLSVALLSLWDAVELPTYGVPEFVKWVQVALLLIVVQDLLQPRALPWLIGGLLAVALAQVGIGFWQFALWEDAPENFRLTLLGREFHRAYGTFEQPNPFAGFLGISLSLAFGGLWSAIVGWWEAGVEPDRRALRAFGWAIGAGAVVAALALGLLMSWSRGGWLGFAAAAVVMALALPRKAVWGIALVALLIVGALGATAVDVLPDALVARLTDFVEYIELDDVRGVRINDANFAVIERLAHWQAALGMFRSNFWTGVGIGCYEPAYAAFALIDWEEPLGHAHNFYLNIAAETGLLGTITYLSFWGVVFWQTWRVTRRAEGLHRGIGIGFLGAWTHLSVHHLFDNLTVNNLHLYIGILLGVLAFLVQAQSGNKEEYDRKSRAFGTIES